jgi:hypothetical protein
MPDSQKKRSCFVIAPIGKPASDTRNRSDQVLKYVFEEALGEQYDLTRSDKIAEPGIITSQIIRELQDSELVLADLTENNANVFYELAVRHAIKKPVIHVIDSHWEIPFDVAPLRTIKFDYTDLASVDDAKKQLRGQAAEIQAGKWGETPIDIANITRPSDQDPENLVLLKQVVEEIASLRATINQVESRMGNQLSDALMRSRELYTWSRSGARSSGKSTPISFYGTVPSSNRATHAVDGDGDPDLSDFIDEGIRQAQEQAKRLEIIARQSKPNAGNQVPAPPSDASKK